MTESPKIGPNRRGNAGKGRPPGSPNRITKTIKQAVESAFSEVGAEAWLIEQARQNPQGFMTLLSRLIPSELKAEVSGSLSLKRVTIHNALPWEPERLAIYADQHDEVMVFDGSGKPLGILIPLDAPGLEPAS